MARSGLSGRLGRIREMQKNAAAFGNVTPTAASAALPGSESATAQSTASGDTEPLSARLPGWERSGTGLFERESFVPLASCRARFSEHLPLLFPRERDELERSGILSGMSSSFVFFDLETTGLSHGAGTVAFMAGLARFNEATNMLSIRQLLLADYPGESEFLDRLSFLVGENPVLVSFNGKAFDSQILFTRFSMNGIQSPFLKRPPVHLDLLYPSRRVWKNQLGSCRLSALEEGVLGIRREDDLPGSEAPDAWFDYVRHGETERLLAIGDHNRDDCATLPALLFALDGAIERGESRAALIRAIDLRSRGDYRGARAFLEPLAEKGDRIALRLLAIDAEHRTDDLDRALSCARELCDEKRIARIERKLGINANHE